MAFLERFGLAPGRRWPRLPRSVRLRGLRFPGWLGKFAPSGLYARSLIIIIAPMILLQAIVSIVFMERHWATVTERLSTAVVRDISAIIDMIESYPDTDNHATIERIARERLDLNVSILPPEPLPEAAPRPFFNILDGILSEEIENQIARPFWIDTVGDSRLLEIRIALDDSVLRIFARRNSAYASNTHIFIVWMVSSSLVLILISVLFLRNQIRPIQKLAEAAESFGRGQPMPPDFRVRGASEVRRASFAFIQMRDRIERQIEQRTQMLSGVSHDLRTVLTRFRLQISFFADSEDRRELEHDIDEMSRMLEGYLAFAKGESGEEPSEVDLQAMLARLETLPRDEGKTLLTTVDGDGRVVVRPDGFMRILTNLTANALRHADRVEVRARRDERWLSVVVDDDGPGISIEDREEAFKPFVRLDAARNIDDGGTGLGLAIARDIARSHGGDIQLTHSPLGGLRATIRIPLR